MNEFDRLYKENEKEKTVDKQFINIFWTTTTRINKQPTPIKMKIKYI
jgi:hypothetical protein